MIRYEDLCLNTRKTVLKLLSFLDLSPNKLIDKFINEHTHSKPEYKNTYGTKRDSKQMAFKWREKLKDEDISNTQDFCAKPMKILGYNLMKNISIDKHNDSYPILGRISDVLDVLR